MSRTRKISFDCRHEAAVEEHLPLLGDETETQEAVGRRTLRSLRILSEDDKSEAWQTCLRADGVTTETTDQCRQCLECERVTETETDENGRFRLGEEMRWTSTIRISEHGWILLERLDLCDKEKITNERDDETMLHRMSLQDSTLTWMEMNPRICRRGSSLEMKRAAVDVREEQAEDGPMSCLANNCILRVIGKGMVINKIIELEVSIVGRRIS